MQPELPVAENWNSLVKASSTNQWTKLCNLKRVFVFLSPQLCPAFVFLGTTTNFSLYLYIVSVITLPYIIFTPTDVFPRMSEKIVRDLWVYVAGLLKLDIHIIKITFLSSAVLSVIWQVFYLLFNKFLVSKCSISRVNNLDTCLC